MIDDHRTDHLDRELSGQHCDSSSPPIAARSGLRSQKQDTSDHDRHGRDARQHSVAMLDQPGPSLSQASPGAAVPRNCRRGR